MMETEENLVLKWNNHLTTFAARLNDLRYEVQFLDKISSYQFFWYKLIVY